MKTDFEKELNEKAWGGVRPGAGAKKKAQVKITKSFSLSRKAVENLKNLEVQLEMSSQSEVIEYLLKNASTK